MYEFMFGGGAIWFTVPAIAGTLFLLAKLVLGEIGGDLDADVDVDVDLDVGAHGGDHGGAEFRALSLQTVAAFCMGGGWMAFTVLRAMETSFLVAALVGVAVGVAMAWFVAWAVAWMARLQTSGSVAIESARGETGEVHVMVPPVGTGSGRVSIVLGGKRREYDATQRGDDVIASHTRVMVVDTDESANALVVERAE